jgi:uncharacterized protein YkwD
MTLILRLFASLVIALTLMIQGAMAQPGYRNYATGLLRAVPEGVRIRPDLESVIDAMASSYRKSNGRSGLNASNLMRQAARAQALDVLLAGRLSHSSRKGHSLRARFEAFADKPELYRSYGENAASDRRRGAAGKDKAARLFKMWTESSGHRRNLLKANYGFVSSGVIERNGELWAVQIFWEPPREVSPFAPQSSSVVSSPGTTVIIR